MLSAQRTSPLVSGALRLLPQIRVPSSVLPLPLSSPEAPQFTSPPTETTATVLADLMRNGGLAPDRLVHAAVCSRIAAPDCVRRGYLLDGFPRTPEQARFLVSPSSESEAMLRSPTAVVELHVEDDLALTRIAGRHAGATAEAEGCSDGAVSPRADDADSKTVLRRLRCYAEHRAEILGTLAAGAHVHVVHAQEGMGAEEVAEVVRAKLGTVVSKGNVAPRIVLAGKPGSGKSAVGTALMEGQLGGRDGPIHISTGALLREWAAL